MQNILALSTKPLVGEKKIVENASLIKVQVIKQKHVDQIKELNLKHGDSFTDLEMIILGRCDQWIIFSDQTKTLRKMARIDFIQYSIEEDSRIDHEKFKALGSREQSKVERNMADAIGKSLDAIPQLFVE